MSTTGSEPGCHWALNRRVRVGCEGASDSGRWQRRRRHPPARRRGRRYINQYSRRRRDTQQHEPIIIRTGYTGRDDLAIYVDGFLRGQAAAVSLIGEHLTAFGFELEAVNRLVADVLELRRYSFRSKDDAAEDASGPCPACGRVMPPQ